MDSHEERDGAEDTTDMESMVEEVRAGVVGSHVDDDPPSSEELGEGNMVR